MHRRSFVALGLSALFVPLSARADSMAMFPPQLRVVSTPTVHAGAGAPTTARWTVRNTGRVPLHLRVGRPICLFQGMRLPLRAVAVRIDGREGREGDVAPGQRAIVDVTLEGFSEPSARSREWTIELSFEVSGEPARGSYAGGTTVVRRARRAG